MMGLEVEQWLSKNFSEWLLVAERVCFFVKVPVVVVRENASVDVREEIESGVTH